MIRASCTSSSSSPILFYSPFTSEYCPRRFSTDIFRGFGGGYRLSKPPECAGFTYLFISQHNLNKFPSSSLSVSCCFNCCQTYTIPKIHIYCDNSWPPQIITMSAKRVEYSACNLWDSVCVLGISAPSKYTWLIYATHIIIQDVFAASSDLLSISIMIILYDCRLGRRGSQAVAEPPWSPVEDGLKSNFLRIMNFILVMFANHKVCNILLPGHAAVGCPRRRRVKRIRIHESIPSNRRTKVLLLLSLGTWTHRDLDIFGPETLSPPPPGKTVSVLCAVCCGSSSDGRTVMREDLRFLDQRIGA